VIFRLKLSLLWGQFEKHRAPSGADRRGPSQLVVEPQRVEVHR
jgi:hypothetical protein